MKTILKIFLAVAVLAAVGWGGYKWWQAAAQNAPMVLDVSEQTTVLVEPLDEDGYVDYVAAVNQWVSADVTPSSNAVVVLADAFGPAPRGKLLDARYFNLLGINAPAEKGNYFQSFSDWLRANTRDKTESEKRMVEHDYCSEHYWSSGQFPELNRWVEQNKNSLDKVRLASLKQNYYSPFVTPANRSEPRLEQVRLPYQSPVLQSARLLAIRARRELQAGNYKGWKRDVLTTCRLAVLISKSASIYEHVIGDAIAHGIADRELASAIQSGKLDLEQLQDLQLALDQIPELSSPERAFRFSQYAGLEFLQTIVRNGERDMTKAAPWWAGDFSDYEMKSPQDINEVARIWNRWHDRMVQPLKITDINRRWAAIQLFDAEYETSIDKSLRKYGSENSFSLFGRNRDPHRYMAHYILKRLAPSLMIVYSNRCRSKTSRTMVKLAIALEIYKRQKGQYPSDLKQLAPEFIDPVPVDSFSTGNPFDYQAWKVEYLLYAKGPGSTTDNGEYLSHRWYRPLTFKQFLDDGFEGEGL